MLGSLVIVFLQATNDTIEGNALVYTVKTGRQTNQGNVSLLLLICMYIITHSYMAWCSHTTVANFSVEHGPSNIKYASKDTLLDKN